MTHITIPSNSSCLYEYVYPQIISVDDASCEDLSDKAKVFINGCCKNIMEKRNPKVEINFNTPKSEFTPSFIEHLKSIHHHCYTGSQ